ncbi:MAG: 2-nitropropane dioxygenase [Clostridiaceae bacterium BRH_c20a]|nr:MAG: 2-nitropropane dioxygenase [Clostridiaceae bacterium BRH_c20a]
MKTRLTELLGIKYPIIQGGMAWVSEANLTSAVSNAGGAGIIASGGRDVEWVRNEIRKTKKLTDKPFGVNIVLLDKDKDEKIAMLCEEKVDFVALGAGNPVPYFQKLKDAGIKVIPVVPSLKLAKRVEESGADALVIEGMEAGGHIGTLTTMALLTNVIPDIKIPVIAAGGIADGRGMAAALLMGAQGVQIGSRFLLASECMLHPKAKEMIIQAVDTDSVVTGYSRGHGVRGLRNVFTDKYLELERSGAPEEELNNLATGTARLGLVDGDVENGLVHVGQSLVPLKEIKSVAEIIDELIGVAQETLRNAGNLGRG